LTARSHTGLFSAVGSAFVIDVQSNLQPDSTNRPKATSARSSPASTDPSFPAKTCRSASVERSPRGDRHDLNPSIREPDVTVGRVRLKVGQQWLNRYLRYPGGLWTNAVVAASAKLMDWRDGRPGYSSRASPSCSRSRSFSSVACRGTCGRSTSVARAVISFTVLGAIFYVGIVIAGTSLYDCPFQTPASTAFRALRQKDDPESFGESITAQGHIVCLHLLEGCPTGAYLEISPHPRGRGEPAALGNFLPHHFRHGHRRRIPNHHSIPPCRSSFREHKAQTGSRSSKVHTRNVTLNHPRGCRPPATCVATSRWVPCACEEHCKPSETERGQRALCVLDHPQHH
jgi:hypothetical protein